MTQQPGGWASPSATTDLVASPPHTADRAPTGARTAVAPTGASPSPVPLRPLGTGELLDGVVGVVKAHPRAVLVLSAVLAIAASAVNLGVTLALLPSIQDVDTRDPDQSLSGLAGAGSLSSLVGLLLGALTTALLAGVVSAVVGRTVLSEGTDLADTWSRVRPRLLPLVAVGLLVGGAVVGALLVAGLLVLGAGAVSAPLGALVAALTFPLAAVLDVWLYTRWCLAPCVVVLEGAGVRVALRRSAALVKGGFWRTFWILVLALVIAALVGLVLQLPVELLSGRGTVSGLGDATTLTARSAVFGALAGALAATIVGPFTGGVRALLYVDRRVRAEGLDLVVAAALPA